MPFQLARGSAPDPGSVARGGPDAPRRSLAGALCAPLGEQMPATRDESRILVVGPISGYLVGRSR